MAIHGSAMLSSIFVGALIAVLIVVWEGRIFATLNYLWSRLTSSGPSSLRVETQVPFGVAICLGCAVTLVESWHGGRPLGTLIFQWLDFRVGEGGIVISELAMGAMLVGVAVLLAQRMPSRPRSARGLVADERASAMLDFAASFSTFRHDRSDFGAAGLADPRPPDRQLRSLCGGPQRDRLARSRWNRSSKARRPRRANRLFVHLTGRVGGRRRGFGPCARDVSPFCPLRGSRSVEPSDSRADAKMAWSKGATCVHIWPSRSPSAPMTLSPSRLSTIFTSRCPTEIASFATAPSEVCPFARSKTPLP